MDATEAVRRVFSGTLQQPMAAAPPAGAPVAFLRPVDLDLRAQRESLAKEVYDSDEEEAAAGPGGGVQCAQQ